MGVAASGHSLAVMSDGSIFSWGRNDSMGGGGHNLSPMEESGQLGPHLEDVSLGQPSNVRAPLNLQSTQILCEFQHGRLNSLVKIVTIPQVARWGCPHLFEACCFR